MLTHDSVEAIRVVLPESPVLEVPKWQREKLAFERLLPELMKSYPGRFVAIHEEQVAGVGDDRLELATEVQRAIGNQAIYVGRVAYEAPRQVRIVTPFIHGRGMTR